jgi:hypothetical protein
VTPIEILMWLLFIGILFSFALVLIAKAIDTRGGRYSPRADSLQREVDLRLTYKRYMELYPSNMSYEAYKKLQVQRAYRKAVSSTRIKRMVR